MVSKLTSRKFWMAIATAACALFLAISGAIDWTLAITVVSAALGAYIGIEGLADAFGRLVKK